MRGHLGPDLTGQIRFVLFLFLFFVVLAPGFLSSSSERPRPDVTFVREPILGHYSWNFHSCQCIFIMVCAGQQWRHGCVGWVLINNGDMDVCWLGAGQQWRHGCVLAGSDQQWRHRCVLAGCWPAMQTSVCALGENWPAMETWVHALVVSSPQAPSFLSANAGAMSIHF